MAIVTSKQFTINIPDVLKGLVMAVLVPVVTVVTQSLDAGNLVFNWKSIAIAALSGFFGYILKNWLSPAKIEIIPANNDQVEAIKSGDAEVKVMPK